MKRVSCLIGGLALILSGIACAPKESAVPTDTKQIQSQQQQNFQKQYAGQQKGRPMPR